MDADDIYGVGSLMQQGETLHATENRLRATGWHVADARSVVPSLVADVRFACGRVVYQDCREAWVTTL